MFQGIIFDLDGTLLNTLDDLTDSVNHILRQYGYPESSRWQVRSNLGNGARFLLTHLLPEKVGEACFEKLLSEYIVYYQEHCLIKTGPFDGIEALVDLLFEKGKQMAIVSNKGDGAVRELADRFFPGKMACSVGERPGIRRKPEPDTLLEAIRLMKLEASQILYVGDSEVDHETAKRAGVSCALVCWGFRDEEQLRQLEPDFLIQRPEELADLILNA